MATQNEHGRLIAAAAKAALAPIGCVRRGQSRVWISDQRYWAIMIEFQPSGFSKGSYLNVGASWLWYERPGLAFNVGYRVAGAGFISFENSEQFRPLIETMAAQAAEAVLALRAKFASIAMISRFLNGEANRQPSDLFGAAVAAGLNHELELSRKRFHEMLSYPVVDEWRVKRHAEAAALLALLDDTAQFRAAVRRTIDARRRQARLPPIADCLEGLDSAAREGESRLSSLSNCA
ncbi:MAG: hypothetical protein ACLPSW_08140 [Roseiarcus sp.]